MVSINGLAGLVMDIAGKQLSIRHIPEPLGVRGRWRPNSTLREGLEKTYAWIHGQVHPVQTDTWASLKNLEGALEEQTVLVPSVAR